MERGMSPPMAPCPCCGIETGVGPCGCQPATTGGAGGDPLIGCTLAERYEVVELLSAGGMGRVYRAIQHPLDRQVAIKVIQPELLGSQEIAMRFLIEARAASRINHSNVVTIYDFGRTPPSEGELLYLVMELLEGPSLAAVLQEGRPMEVTRIVDIMKQMLAALAEAHRCGITHRDVKPENILLQRGAPDGERVKLIDFGIARLVDGRRITQHEAIGTPYYMAPEQIDSVTVGPSADIYAAGVVLFEMLTGRLPFTADSALGVVIAHAEAPRPDPRDVAPERDVPIRLAEICRRAMSIAPEDRYPGAEDMARALVEALTERGWSSRDASLFSSKPPGGRVSPAPQASRPPDSRPPRRTTAETPSGVQLLARREDLAWAIGQLEDRGVRAVLLWGAAGTGRTALLGAIGDALREEGAVVVELCTDARLLAQVGHAALKAAIVRLSDVPESDPGLRSGGAAIEPLAAAGLRALFAGSPTPAPGDPTVPREACAAALDWAARRAMDRVPTGRVILTIDDVDRLDGASLLGLADFLWKYQIPGFYILATSESAPDLTLTSGLRQREIYGLPQADAERLLGSASAALVSSEGDLEPLYLVQLAAWHGEQLVGTPPPGLQEIIEWRLRNLAPAELRVIEALAAVGAASRGELARLLGRSDDVDRSIGPLRRGGFVLESDGLLTLAHAIFAGVALNLSPAGFLEDVHERAAEALVGAPAMVELRAFHALRGRPGFEAFLLAEQATRLRAVRDDHNGEIGLLTDALRAAHRRFLTGELDGSSARSVFGRKLAEALLRAGRPRDAYGVLAETLDIAPGEPAIRALLLERMSMAAQQCDRPDEAARLRSEALALAERLGDVALLDRLRAPSGVVVSRPRLLVRRTPSPGESLPPRASAVVPASLIPTEDGESEIQSIGAPSSDPAKDEAASSWPSGGSRASSTARIRSRLLLVLSDASAAARLAPALRRAGAHSVLVRTRTMALAVRGPFDAGLFGFDLPDGDGIATAEQLLRAGVVRSVLFFGITLDRSQRHRAQEIGPLVDPSQPLYRIVAEIRRSLEARNDTIVQPGNRSDGRRH